MNYIFHSVIIELGVSTIAAAIALVAIIVHFYIFFKLYGETQLIALFLSILCFIFTLSETINIIVSLSIQDVKLSLLMYKIEQIAISLTILPWIRYVKTTLKLNDKLHSFLDRAESVAIFLFMVILVIALIYSQLFVSTTEVITTLNSSAANSVKIRGAIGPIYIFRDFIFSVYSVIIICMLFYEIFVNKIYQVNIGVLVLVSLISLAFFDDFNGISTYSKYSSNYLLFPAFSFSRFSLVYMIFNIFSVYGYTVNFINTVYKKSDSKDYDLESIKAQDAIIINTAINTLSKLLEFKEHFHSLVGTLVDKVKNTNLSVNNLKGEIAKVIDNTNEFITIENFQVNDGNTNIEKIEQLIETYPNLQVSSEIQKNMLEEYINILQESVKEVYVLQSESVHILRSFEEFQSNIEKERNAIIKILDKALIFNQLSFQINKILSFMTNMQDKVKTLSINSSIQASKSGEWYHNFNVVSKEVSELVVETGNITQNMQKLLFQIEEIFKRYNYASNSIKAGIMELIRETSSHYNRLIKFNNTMERQNDYNINIIKSTDKIYNSISDMSTIIVNEENDFMNIKTKIEEFNDYISDISQNANNQNIEIKNIMKDMNKLVATNEDFEDITNKLDEESKKLLEYSDNLKKVISEYSKVI
ncbi:methyl-accepting chemotaxis protein [Brachyspira pilosicoli]|uniref:Methyl-accepting chemotaxis protein n=1 Tax=Brachyspira pilosicoli TaxID=52584 RepID=A0A5C8EKZ1_BRAPL|nr:methyl-accepting chemotaxis protein [Brachyspira pilosicoli]TXJ37412.1 methyl-accepting chemotaxis protein [Brachyspira pilosicoli]